MDPRVKTPASGLEQQFQLSQKLASYISQSSVAVLQAKSVQEQVAKLKPTGALADALKAFNAKVTAALEGPENPPANSPKPPSLSSVNGDAYSLYGMIGQADVAPTSAQVQAVAKLDGEIPVALNQWSQIMKTDLPAINTQLKQAGLPEINPELKPVDGESQGDEE
jgi:hypothetical protein